MLTATTKNALRSEILLKEAQLALANTALSDALSEVLSHKLDTGEGSQSTRYRDLNELQEAISHLETSLRSLYRRLNGTGIVNINVRRKHFTW